MNQLVDRRAVNRRARVPSEIPPSWLAAIKEAVKPQLWTSLFGSAVLAALIGLASSYLTARMTISSQLRLERQKASFQFQQERAKDQAKAYQVLADKVGDLHDAYLSYLIFTKIAVDHGLTAQDRKNLILQANAVGKLEREVMAARRDFSIASQEVENQTDSCLADLAGIRQAGDQDPASVLKQKGLVDRLQDLGKRTQAEADRARQQVSDAGSIFAP